MDSTKIIKRILSHDNLIYLELPKKIIKEYLVKYKKSNNEENKNSKIDIIKLSEYMELDKIKIVKLLYFNIDNFNHVLYNCNSEIILKEEEKKISYIFHATLLLIEGNQNIINYSFTIKLIQYINKIIENHKNIYSNLILSKAIFDLIALYKGLDEYYNKVKEIQ